MYVGSPNLAISDIRVFGNGDKLYQTHQVWADSGETLELRALTVGQDYFVAIEAFDEKASRKAARPWPSPRAVEKQDDQGDHDRENQRGENALLGAAGGDLLPFEVNPFPKRGVID